MKSFKHVTVASLAALTLSLSATSFADAKTIIVNNENTDRFGGPESLGTVPTSVVMKNTDGAIGKVSHEAKMIDKVFDVPKGYKDDIITSRDQIPGVEKNYNVGDKKDFTTVNMITNADETTSATLKYNGKKAQVWVGDPNVTEEEAAKIGQEFDNVIGPLVEEKFTTPSDVDGNGKINILVFDIKDDFEQTGSYVGGYFHARDLLMMQGSNHSEIFYMDTYPSMGKDRNVRDVTKIFSTLAHEYQHMVNFYRNFIVEDGAVSDNKMDTWLNEAFSMASEHMYLKSPLTKRIEYYNKSESIANGHSLIQWSSGNTVLSNYSLSYLFGQYLRTQADNGDAIFKEILLDKGNTMTTLQNAIHKHVDPNMTVGQFMTNFRQALEKKAITGPYGFNGEAGFNAIQPLRTTTMPEVLSPQGSVIFEAADNFKVPADAGKNIKFVEVGNDTPVVDEPTAEEPTAEEPTAEEPTTEEPTTEVPLPQKPEKKKGNGKGKGKGKNK